MSSVEWSQSQAIESTARQLAVISTDGSRREVLVEWKYHACKEPNMGLASQMLPHEMAMQRVRRLICLLS